jgi:hypothetical protein
MQKSFQGSPRAESLFDLGIGISDLGFESGRFTTHIRDPKSQIPNRKVTLET